VRRSGIEFRQPFGHFNGMPTHSNACNII